MLTQQIFHPSLFIKQRSTSLSDLGQTTKTNQIDVTIAQNEPSSPLNENSEENNPQYPAPLPSQRVGTAPSKQQKEKNE